MEGVSPVQRHPLYDFRPKIGGRHLPQGEPKPQTLRYDQNAKRNCDIFKVTIGYTENPRACYQITPFSGTLTTSTGQLDNT